MTKIRFFGHDDQKTLLFHKGNNGLQSYTFHWVRHRVCELIILYSISHIHLQSNILDEIFSAKYPFYQIIRRVWQGQPQPRHQTGIWLSFLSTQQNLNIYKNGMKLFLAFAISLRYILKEIDLKCIEKMSEESYNILFQSWGDIQTPK